MSASIVAGLTGLVMSVVGVAGLLGLEAPLGLAFGFAFNLVTLLVGIALLIAAVAASPRRPVIGAAAILYSAFALLGLNAAFVIGWPAVFGLDGRSVALALSALLVVTAMVARDATQQMAEGDASMGKRRRRQSQPAPPAGPMPPIQPELAKPRPTPWQGERAPALFTSLEQPPSPAEVAAMLAKGVRFFDFDLSQSPEQGTVKAAIAAIKAGGGKIGAYHVGGGGGAAWGGASAGEEEVDLTDPEILEHFKKDVADLVLKGADFVHIDNMHRFKNADDLALVVDAVKSMGCGVIDKNIPELWADLLDKRPDLKPPYAILENAVQQSYQAPAIKRLADTHGVPLYIVDFERNLDRSKGPTLAKAKAYADKNPWIKGIFLMPDEKAFEGRTAMFIAPAVEDVVPMA